MRLALLLAAALLLAPAAAAGEQPRSALVKDHRDLKLFRRELVEDRKVLDLLRSRLERLTSLYSARVLDPRSIGELHARVHEELQRDARASQLRTLPTIQDATQARAAVPGSTFSIAQRGWLPPDQMRVDQIPPEWAALKDRYALADVEARYKLLSERVALARFKLSADLKAFRWLGGDADDLEDEAAEDEAPAAR